MPSIVARRAITIVAICLFFAMATVLLLADRSGSIVGDLNRVLVNTGQEVEQTYNIDFIDREDIPGTLDQVGHAVLWGTGMLVVGYPLRLRAAVPVTAMLMAGASLAFEVAQPVLSSSREFEQSDAVGNLAGITVAAVLLATAIGLLNGRNA